MNVPSAVTAPKETAFMSGYLDALAMVERLHRLLLDVIKDEFERVGALEINAVQALLLFNVGENELTAGELKTRGYYQGSNVSYNLKNWSIWAICTTSAASLIAGRCGSSLPPRAALCVKWWPVFLPAMPKGLSPKTFWIQRRSKIFHPRLNRSNATGLIKSGIFIDVINCLMLSRFTNAPYCPSRPKARPGQALGHLAAIPPRHYPASVQRPCVHQIGRAHV